jgi:hypothetical protein
MDADFVPVVHHHERLMDLLRVRPLDMERAVLSFDRAGLQASEDFRSYSTGHRIVLSTKIGPLFAIRSIPSSRGRVALHCGS